MDDKECIDCGASSSSDDPLEKCSECSKGLLCGECMKAHLDIEHPSFAHVQKDCEKFHRFI